jgi:hypothetical protein
MRVDFTRLSITISTIENRPTSPTEIPVVTSTHGSTPITIESLTTPTTTDKTSARSSTSSGKAPFSTVTPNTTAASPSLQKGEIVRVVFITGLLLAFGNIL